MKDLFDFIAGTSTGSIIAASLAMPKNESVNGKTVLSKTEPLYFADEIIQIYRNDNDKIFDKNQFSIGWVIAFNVITFPLFVYLGFYFGKLKFDNEQKINQFEIIRKKIEDLQFNPGRSSKDVKGLAINDDSDRETQSVVNRSSVLLKKNDLDDKNDDKKHTSNEKKEHKSQVVPRKV